MIPRYLTAFAQAKQVAHSPYIVVGSGIAGLFTALQLAAAGQKVLLLAKGNLVDSNTWHAQGGIAAVTDDRDSPDLHFTDTMRAGAGLCEPEPVRVLVEEGPARIQDLLRLGINFDLYHGSLALTKEGAHSRRRILHAQGDATGRVLAEGLIRAVACEPAITLKTHAYVLDVVTQAENSASAQLKTAIVPGLQRGCPQGAPVCQGILVWEGGELLFYPATAVILATGGAGQIYEYTTNPLGATGDGLAVALRAGAVLADLEFMQFHPTALYLPPAPRFLISEAIRGEGAILRNASGERFMTRYHKLAELAPRDVVAKAIVREMRRTNARCVYLDLSPIGAAKIRRRFPTILARCQEYGLDITRTPIPVAPAAHYLMGGIRTDLCSRTNVAGLFACGEVACTGVHGANRLASNSLLEGLVFGARAAKAAQAYVEQHQGRSNCELPLRRTSNATRATLAWPALKQRIGQIMHEYGGIERDATRLVLGQEQIKAILEELTQTALAPGIGFEVYNMALVARAMLTAALLRQESRGGHERVDFPERDDLNWRQHIIMWRE